MPYQGLDAQPLGAGAALTSNDGPGVTPLDVQGITDRLSEFGKAYSSELTRAGVENQKALGIESQQARETQLEEIEKRDPELAKELRASTGALEHKDTLNPFNVQFANAFNRAAAVTHGDKVSADAQHRIMQIWRENRFKPDVMEAQSNAVVNEAIKEIRRADPTGELTGITAPALLDTHTRYVQKVREDTLLRDIDRVHSEGLEADRQLDIKAQDLVVGSPANNELFDEQVAQRRASILMKKESGTYGEGEAQAYLAKVNDDLRDHQQDVLMTNRLNAALTAAQKGDMASMRLNIDAVNMQIEKLNKGWGYDDNVAAKKKVAYLQQKKSNHSKVVYDDLKKWRVLMSEGNLPNMPLDQAEARVRFLQAEAPDKAHLIEDLWQGGLLDGQITNNLRTASVAQIDEMDSSAAEWRTHMDRGYIAKTNNRMAKAKADMQKAGADNDPDATDAIGNPTQKPLTSYAKGPAQAAAYEEWRRASGSPDVTQEQFEADPANQPLVDAKFVELASMEAERRRIEHARRHGRTVESTPTFGEASYSQFKSEIQGAISTGDYDGALRKMDTFAAISNRVAPERTGEAIVKLGTDGPTVYMAMQMRRNGAPADQSKRFIQWSSYVPQGKSAGQNVGAEVVSKGGETVGVLMADINGDDDSRAKLDAIKNGIPQQAYQNESTVYRAYAGCILGTTLGAETCRAETLNIIKSMPTPLTVEPNGTRPRHVFLTDEMMKIPDIGARVNNEISIENLQKVYKFNQGMAQSLQQHAIPVATRNDRGEDVIRFTLPPHKGFVTTPTITGRPRFLEVSLPELAMEGYVPPPPKELGLIDWLKSHKTGKARSSSEPQSNDFEGDVPVDGVE